MLPAAVAILEEQRKRCEPVRCMLRPLSKVGGKPCPPCSQIPYKDPNLPPPDPSSIKVVPPSPEAVEQFERSEAMVRKYKIMRIFMSVLGTAGLIAGGYHGFKRSGGDLGPTLGYGLFGGALAPLALPIFFFQGFGKRKKS
tara:strand:- start:1502 stop:1924 length:423 start_codon:yes stop_codon:yes gene_type:complete